jgi:hypothetical protein
VLANPTRDAEGGVMSKLFKFKKWLTLDETAKRLSLMLEDEISKIDVLKFALDGHLMVSILFANQTLARRASIISRDETKLFKELFPLYEDGKLDGKFSVYMDESNRKELAIETDSEILYLYDDAWDLGMIGGEVSEIKSYLCKELSLPREETTSLDGCFVKNDDGQLFQLVGMLDKIESAYPLGCFPDNCTIVVRTRNIEIFESSFSGGNVTNALNTSENPSETVLKMLAGLALVLSEKGGKYKRGENPNYSQISQEIETVCKSIPNADTFGLSPENIRKFISQGLAMLVNT